MRRILVMIIMAFILFALIGCGQLDEGQQQEAAGQPLSQPAPLPASRSLQFGTVEEFLYAHRAVREGRAPGSLEIGGSGDWDLGPFRPRFYNMPRHFVDLAEREAFIAWSLSRSDEERDNVSIAVGFIQHFNISKEDFTRANDEWAQSIIDRGQVPNDRSRNELYPVDLIFTFDNEAINEFFRWEGSPFAHEVGLAPSPPLATLPFELSFALEEEAIGMSQFAYVEPIIVHGFDFILESIEDNPAILANLEKEGYTFLGWDMYHHDAYHFPDKRIEVTDTTRMPAHDVTLYARWQYAN